MSTRILHGRSFLPSDRERTRDSAFVVIDEVVARRAFPGQNPVGQRLQIEPSEDENPFAEVLGVVEHSRTLDLSKEGWGQIYHPGWGGNRRTAVVRTTSPPESLVRPVEDLVRALNPGLPLIDPLPMNAYVDEALAANRFSLMLMSLFGAMALGLVAIGIYGVVSYGVGLRLREFAIRLALGEAPGRLTVRVLLQGLSLVTTASLVGLAASWVLTAQLRDLLFWVDLQDPYTMAAAASVLFSVALLASYLPARRASRVEPATLLQQD